MRRAVGRGRQGPGLLGTAARTAVIAGTATAVSGKVAAAQQASFAAQAPPPAAQPVPMAAPVPVAAPAAAQPIDVDVLHAQLMKLAELRSAGLLTDAEFEVQKARLLAG